MFLTPPLCILHQLWCPLKAAYFTKNKDVEQLRSKGHLRHLVIHKAINAINEILLAYKLVRIGHIDSCGLRTVGIYDALFYFSVVDGVPSGDLNMKL
jgi:hypothetical protein